MSLATDVARLPARPPRFAALRRLRLGDFPLLPVLILGTIALVAIFAEQLAPHNPEVGMLTARFKPPFWMKGGSAEYLLGTDQLGRDVLSRLLFGGRTSLGVGFLATFIGAAVGTVLGLITGYLRGIVDGVVMRVLDVLLAFPGILLAIGIIAMVGPGEANVVLAVSVFGVPIFARVVRGEVLRLREQPFVEAARAAGTRPVHIMTRHLMPNVLPLVVVYATLRVATAILIASSLGVLGLGAQPPSPEWGTMLADGRELLSVAPLVALFPGLAILLTVLALNLFGDGLRDALDPRMRGETEGRVGG
jgi:glutathione transport system permease protein